MTTSNRPPHGFHQPIQGYVTSYAPRLRQFANALIQPVLSQTSSSSAAAAAAAASTTGYAGAGSGLGATPAAGVRTTKRGTTVINYAEDGFDDEDFEESDSPGTTATTGRRGGYGGRGVRRGAAAAAAAAATDEVPTFVDRGAAGERLGTEIGAPVKVQPNFREWVVKKPLKPGKRIQKYSQAHLPLTLVPIRIDVEIPAHTPIEPFYLPRNYHELGINPHHPAYRKPDPAPPYRIKDAFLWNLHEALITPEEFAATLLRDLDVPNVQPLAVAVATQIRQQLEEYAGVALHPLFQSSPNARPDYTNAPKAGSAAAAASVAASDRFRDVSGTATPVTPLTPATDAHPQLPQPLQQQPQQQHGDKVKQTQVNARTIIDSSPEDDELNHDDAYRCIITLNINLSNKLYTDKFEWSLLHSQAAADSFARVTCADLGLPGEWVAALSHGICEAVLRLKKEVCESGGLISGMNAYGNEIDNQAVNGADAGWRYDPDTLGFEWEPRIEVLSPEEIERREGDREREIRRLRRETARFSSTSGLLDTQHARQGSYSIFDAPDPTESLGRGERTKKKKRFRSLSPLARGNTPGRGVPDATGYGGGGGQLSDWERQSWRCSNCWVYGTSVWAVRDGPDGPRTLCNNCGLLYERTKRLPVWQKGLHALDLPLVR